MAAAEDVANMTRQDQMDEILTLKNEAQHLGQTEQDQTEQDAVRTEYRLRRRELEREYSGMRLQEQKCKLEQSKNDMTLQCAKKELE